MYLSKHFQPFAAQFKRLCLAAGLALFSMAGNAAILSGSTVDYHFDDGLLNNLFGAFSISGDVLSFSPTGFVALANDLPIITTNATTPLIGVTAKSGYALTGLTLREQGDYYRIESAPASSFVAVGGEFIVNGNATQFSANQPLTAAFSFAELAGGAKFATSAWDVDVAVALNAVEAANVKVQNILIAGVAGLGNSAFIEKKLLNIGAVTASIATTPVPVPGAVWMFGSVLLSWLGTRRNRVRK
jgi:hypothetical protein